MAADTVSWWLLWTNMEFQRPWWLLLLPLLAAGYWRWLAHSRSAGWLQSIDARKAARLRVSHGGRAGLVLIACSTMIAILALAGPGVKSRHGNTAVNHARVFVMELSPSMLTQDIRPDRLNHAKLKLLDLLRQKSRQPTALVVYGADAYQVSPFSYDANIAALAVTSLHPDIMPQPGSNFVAAVTLARDQLKQQGHRAGDIILLTDGVEANDIAIVESMWPTPFRLSVLAVGTGQGAQTRRLKSLATHTGGRFAMLTSDSADVEHLSQLSFLHIDKAKTSDHNPDFDQHKDIGYWLVLALIPLVLVGFRKNLIWVVVPLMVIAPDSHAYEWADLWLTKEQQAQRALQQGNAQLASQLFRNSSWRAISLYRARQYQQASETLRNAVHADDQFNRANAQALSGDLQGALLSYRRAFDLYTDTHDIQHTIHNMRVVTYLLNEETRRDVDFDEKGAAAEPLEGNVDRPIENGVAGTAAADNRDNMAQLSSEPADSSSATAASNISNTGPQNKLIEAQRNKQQVADAASAQAQSELPAADPGGYLRRKFAYMAQHRQQQLPASVDTRPVEN